MVSRVIAQLFLGLRHSRWGWGVSPTTRPPLPPRTTRYPFYRRLGGPQGRSGRVGNLRPHRDSIPDRPARSQSLYRLSYPAHQNMKPNLTNYIKYKVPKCILLSDSRYDLLESSYEHGCKPLEMIRFICSNVLLHLIY
jgi:hypothetical protein